jgi:cell division protein FtsL
MTRARLEMACALVLLAGVVASGVALVTTIHQSRGLFQEREELRSEQDRLQDDWSALQIEVSRLASHGRIDSIAREQLGFTEPGSQREFAEAGR